MMLHIDCCSDGCRAVYMALSHGYSQSPSRNDLFNMEKKQDCSRSQQFWEMQSLPGPHMSLSMGDLWIDSSQIELDLSHGNTHTPMFMHLNEAFDASHIYLQTEAMGSGCLQPCFIHCFVVDWLHVRSCLCLGIILYPMCCRFYLALTVSRSFEGTTSRHHIPLLVGLLLTQDVFSYANLMRLTMLAMKRSFFTNNLDMPTKDGAVHKRCMLKIAAFRGERIIFEDRSLGYPTCAGSYRLMSSRSIRPPPTPLLSCVEIPYQTRISEGYRKGLLTAPTITNHSQKTCNHH